MIDLSILDINLFAMAWLTLLLIFIAIFEYVRFKKFEKKYLKTTEIIPKVKESSSSSKSSSDSELTIEMSLQKKLNECSVSGEANELPIDPELVVENVGKLNLPLSEEQAQDLIKICTHSTYGRKIIQNNELNINENVERVLDTEFRDSYELDPFQFEIRHPEWQKEMNKLANKAANEMASFDSKVYTKLSKLILYKKGSHFSRHIDRKKDEHMFGTLVVQLPSQYTGGEFIFHYYAEGFNRENVHDFGKSTGKSSSVMHYSSHFYDVEHEIKLITSGYRLVLVYLLCCKKKYDFYRDPMHWWRQRPYNHLDPDNELLD